MNHQDELTSASYSETKHVNRTPRSEFKRPNIDKFQFATTTTTPRVPFGSNKRGMNTPATSSRSTATTSSNQQFTVTTTAKDPSVEIEPLQVYCRVKLQELSDGEACVNVNDNHSITVFPPDSLAWTKAKQVEYSFDRIFSHTAPQKELFDQVARPLVQDLLDGKSSLLFAFGVTGSGKTYTMSGTPAEPGIMPRALDVLFNSIGRRKAPKYSFKSDHMNGFEAQTKAEIALQLQILRSSSQRNLRSGTLNGGGEKRQLYPQVPEFDTDEEERSHDTTILPIQFTCSVFSVFVTYTQIYNNNVYDLLDGEVSLDLGKKTNGPQSKITRADAAGNMYVHNVVEIEVESAEEALEVLKRGQKKRKFAQTLLNTESSRSHSIFNIRLVQAPLDATGEEILGDKNLIRVSQLSLVDLAGSERNTRTQTAGDRLREAGRINTSIMNLHKCLTALRKRQQRGAEKVSIPYRDDKLTNFLKSYFEGQGRIRMLLCINPRAEDYAENLHVCAFAEKAQEIEVVRQPVRVEPVTPSVRRKGNGILKEAPPPLPTLPMEENVGLIGSINISQPLPFARFVKPEEGREILENLRQAIVNKMDLRTQFLAFLQQDRNDFRRMLAERERDLFSTNSDVEAITMQLRKVDEEKAEMQDLILKLTSENSELSGEKSDLERTNESLAQEVAKWREDYRQLEFTHHEERNRLLTDAEIQRELEKIKRERQMMSDEAKLKAKYRVKDKAIAAMKELVNNVETRSSRHSRSRTRRSRHEVDSMSLSTSSESDLGLYVIKSPPRAQPSSSRVTSEPRLPVASSFGPPIEKSSMAISNMRRSRSQATEQGTWVEHTPNVQLLKSQTVFQPVLKKKKSVNKLVNVDDLTAAKTSKYCLRTDIQDSEGEVETQLYKGDVLQTVTGGAQVVFNDVEILKQVSPSRMSPTRKRGPQSANELLDREELKAKCKVGIGHQSPVGKRFRQD